MFKIKSIIIKDKKTGQRKVRYYANIIVSGGKKIPLILNERPNIQLAGSEHPSL